MQKLYTNDRLSLQFAILIVLQPLIDIYRLFVGNGIEIAGISVVELVNMFLIGYLGILFILNKRKIKTFYPAFGYAVVLFIYLVFHCLNILKFNTSIIEGTSINVMVEIYVIVRAYILPVLVFYMLICVKTTEKRFLGTMVGVAGFISIVCVITNLFKVSYVSYASTLEKNEMISQNIIEWFIKSPPKDLNLITSKGWFYSGNQIGLILLMLFPIVIYYALIKKSIKSYLLVAIQAIAMIMVSTKTAALGAVAVIFIMVLLQIVFGIYEKKVKDILGPVIVILAIGVSAILIIQTSPVQRMVVAQGMSYLKGEEEINLDDELGGFTGSDFDIKGFSKFLNKYYYIYGIQEESIKLLPVEKNAEFWLSVISDPNKNQVNFRKFKQRILNEVIAKNDNAADKYLGIGYTTNFPYLEQDILAQNAWFGIVGTVLLLGPFGVIFLLSILQIVVHFKRNFKLYHCVLGLSICGGISGSYIAGHLCGYFFPILIFIYILVQLYQATFVGWKRQRGIKAIELPFIK